MRKPLRLFVLLVASVLPALANAVATNPGVRPNEWRLLPRHCMYVEGAPGRTSDPATTRRMLDSDPTWVHMHHYCWAIVQEFRTFRSNMPRREAELTLDAAVMSLDYVIERSRPGFQFRPDMFVRKARLLARRGKFIEAADAARQLIAESPALPEGYIALADVQIKAGRPDQARETLERGEAAVKDKERFGVLKAQLTSR